MRSTSRCQGERPGETACEQAKPSPLCPPDRTETQSRATDKARAKPTGTPRPQRDALQGERQPQRRDATSHGAPPGGRSAHVTTTDHCSWWPSARRSTAISLRLDLGKMPLSLAAPAAPVPVSRHAPREWTSGQGQGACPEACGQEHVTLGPHLPQSFRATLHWPPSRGRVACASKERTELRLLTLTIPRGPKGQVSATEVILSPRSKGTTSGSQSPRGKGTKS